MIYVFDACAMIAYLKREPGGDLVNALLEKENSRCVAHSINLCEVFYDCLRVRSRDFARKFVDDLLADGVEERSDLDRPFWEGVGTLKARGRISIADCFCLALAQRLDGTVVTSDRAEFGPLEALGICPITFIR